MTNEAEEDCFEYLVDGIRNRMESMTDNDRLDLFSKLLEGYCLDCGSKSNHSQGYCTKDER